MATDPVTVAVKTKPVTRQKLSQFLPNHELVKSLENLTSDVGTTLPDAANDMAVKIASLQDDVSDLQSQVSDLSSRVSGLENQVMTLNQEVADLIASSSDAAIGRLRAQLTLAIGLIEDRYKGPKP